MEKDIVDVIYNVMTPHVEIVDLNNKNKFPNVYKIVEYVGRTCYQTQEKIDSVSWKNFIKRAAREEHRSIFEFNNFLISAIVNKDILIDDLIANPYIDVNFDYIGNKQNIQYRLNMCGSIRAILEVLEDYAFKSIENVDYELLCSIFNELNDIYYDFVNNWSTSDYLYEYYDNRKPYEISITDISPYVNSQNSKAKILVKVITSRGVHNEFVRHRMTHKKGGVSYMAESQRYVRYGTKKPFHIVVPSKYINDKKYVYTLQTSAELSFKAYKELLHSGYSPSLACAALPRSTAIEYFIYTTIEEWRHIFKLRTSKYAHVEFQEVASKIREEMINKGLYM